MPLDGIQTERSYKFSVLSYKYRNDKFITLSPRKKYSEKLMRKPYQSPLLLSQYEHYCQNGVVVQALTSIRAEDVSDEITPMA